MSTYESLGPSTPDDEKEPEPFGYPQSRSTVTKYLKLSYKVLSSRDFLKALGLGQCLSILLCGCGVFSGLLQNQDVNIPTAQNFSMYCVLCLVFTTQLAYKQGEGNLVSVLKSSRGWKYVFLGVIDVEANFLVVKAYGYTSVTSVQVLDCFSIAVVLFLSRVFLKTKYNAYQYTGVGVCLVGLMGLIGADVMTGRNSGSTESSNAILGDLLVILGASLYGISNVIQEFVVKNFNISECLGMLGLFSTLLSGIQVIVLESDAISNVDFASYQIALPWLGFTICLTLIYMTMAYVIQQTSATVTNLSILSADFYALVLGIFIFGYSFHFLYIISFVAVITGIAVYNIKTVEEQKSVNNDSLVGVL